jgi:tetratricopeptide (TPR) repeat protein
VDQQTKVSLQHDPSVPTTEYGLPWASVNRRSVIVIATLAVSAIVLLVLAGVFYSKRAEAASVAFGAAMQAYQTPLATPGQQVPPGTKTYASVAERAKAANDLFMACAGQYSLMPEGKVCLYFGGLTYVEEAQNGAAESTLKQVADGWNGDLAALAKLSLAQLYRQTGKDAMAIDLYNQLTAKPTSTVPAGLAQLQLAELYTAEGKPEQAKKIYAQLKDKAPKSAAGVLAAQKLNPSTAPSFQGQ